MEQNSTQSSLRITFLGTGTSHGVPVVGCSCRVCISTDPKDKRLRTSIHLEANGKSIVIDTGPDFRQQMLRHQVKRLDAVVYTHEHKDHTGGLDDVRGFNLFQDSPIPLYARTPVLDRLRQEYGYIFNEDYPSLPQITLQPITKQPFEILGIPFVPIEVQHYQLSVLGFRINNFTYITDAKVIEPAEKKKMYGTHTLVLNAIHYEQNVAHFTIEEALALVEEIQPVRTYFVHMSHQVGLHCEVEKTLPPGVSLAHDGLVIEL